MWKQLKTQIWDWRGVWMTAPSVAVIVIAMRLAGWLQPLEWGAFDQIFRLRSPEPVDARIVIVGVNEADLKKVGQWPVPDAVMATLLEKLKAQKPKAIGLDFYRDLPVQPGHESLIKVFKTTPNLIGVEKILGDDRGSAVAASSILGQLNQVGANDVIVDADGKLRRGLLYLIRKGKEDQVLESFGMRLALVYLEAQGITPQPAKTNPDYVQLGQGIFQKFAPNDGGYVNADDGGYQILLNYRGAANSFRTVSMTDVLEDRIPPDLVRDRIVLVGATATSLNDFFYTPYSGGLSVTPERTSGVEIQANLASQVISSALEGRTGIKTWSKPVELVWIVFWSFTGATLCWTLRNAGGIIRQKAKVKSAPNSGVALLHRILGQDRQKNIFFLSFFSLLPLTFLLNLLPRWTVISLLLAAASLVGSAYLAFLGGLWIPVMPPMLALLGSAIVITNYVANVEREDRQTVMNLFGRHVTSQIAEAIWRDRDRLLKEGRLPGQKLTATVIFTDLKGFSTVAELVEPEVLMSWLNEYMDAMSQIVLDGGGIIDKYIGDAIMAVFGVPIPRTTPEAIAQDAIAAVACSLAMARRLQSLNEQWQAEGRPMTSMRIGIATGKVVAGSLGSSQRLDYTTLGDSVNVAARLESYNKDLDGGICRILINEETYYHIQGKFTTKFIGYEQLKGRGQQTEIYQVLLD